MAETDVSGPSEPDLDYTSVGKWLMDVCIIFSLYIQTHSTFVGWVFLRCFKRWWGFTKTIPKLHVISTNQQNSTDLLDVLRCIYPYVDAIHLREKRLHAYELETILNQIKQAQIPMEKIIINDRIDMAYMMKTKGVQLAYHSPSTKLVSNEFTSLIVGKSVHTLEQAKQAEEERADYVLFGHVFPSQCKMNQPHQGIEALAKVVKALHIPVIAVGGITHENVRHVLNTGVAGIAVMSGVFMAKQPAEAAKMYQRLLYGGDDDEQLL
ncbi:thiazole tautomerase (transcriptional regulator TenI) [Bacillus iocasae]|uniref:Thiazole tautomerase (Transcriptional regulator TenI) n=2 Tax=Priestia iocasae TaxID=2291674 RepID=A0ABS2QTB5_9BACI|nr:thiazole tautomerase (transcriptional regulator TenI) [Metabacillus iocasae]